MMFVNSRVQGMRGLKVLFSLSLCLGLGSLGCKPKIAPPSPMPTADAQANRPQDVLHKVSFSGETLAVIANWYTGKASNWSAIKAANPGLKPERMTIGQQIIIPAALVSERRPMTKKFLQENKLGAVKTTKNSKAGSAEVKAVEQKSGDEKVLAPGEPAKDSKKGPKANAAGGELNLEELLEKEAAPAENVKANAPTAEAPKPADAPAAVVAPDAERDKLLDELLNQ